MLNPGTTQVSRRGIVGSETMMAGVAVLACISPDDQAEQTRDEERRQHPLARRSEFQELLTGSGRGGILSSRGYSVRCGPYSSNLILSYKAKVKPSSLLHASSTLWITE